MISGCVVGATEQFAKSVIAKIITNNVRTFYNDSESAIFFAEQLRERYKQQHAAPPEKPKKQFPWKYLYGGPRPEGTDSFLKNYIYDRRKKMRLRKTEDMGLLHKRQKLLGIDLGAAVFIVHCGGKVKFKGHTDWIDYSTRKTIPKEYDAKYHIEAMDLNKFDISYRGLDNIISLAHLQWLSFKGCPSFDDWHLDKISAEYPILEYLDISECKNVTERGLESLYRMAFLKTLIITKYYDSPAFELTCLMLEDVNPHLKIKIMQPGEM